MISRFFSKIAGAIGIFFRLLRAYSMRFLSKFVTRFRNVTDVSLQAAKAVPKALSSVAVAGQKPTKREDYIETERLYISKSFIAISIITLVVAALLFYFLLWPLLQRTFFTARMYIEDKRVSDYSGKVMIYYDKPKKILMFSGRYTDGLAQGPGNEYDETGALRYSGEYTDGIYKGKGQLYSDGILVYEGDFEAGAFEGAGTLYGAQGVRYIGNFSGGEFSGQGSLYFGGNVIYQGDFAAGKYHGEGTMYNATGGMTYKGSFVEGKQSGQGVEYHDNGVVKYRGTFFESLYEERGRLYDEKGAVIYEGDFRHGRYHGDGVLNTGDGRTIEGKFEAGEPTGNVSIYKSGRICYSGEVSKLLMHGYGSYYALRVPEILYQGLFKHGALDGASLIGVARDDARNCFMEKGIVEIRGVDGFSIVCPRMGVTMYLNLKTESSDPVVQRLYWYTTGADAFEALPWETAEGFEAWRAFNKLPQADKIESGYDMIVGSTPLGRLRYHRTIYSFEDETIALWSFEADGVIFMVEWLGESAVMASGGQNNEPGSGGDSPGGSGAGGSGTGGNSAGGSGAGGEDSLTGRLDNLLSNLGVSKQAPGAPGAPCKYYGGDTDIAGLLSGIPHSDIVRVLAAMADFIEAAEGREAYEALRDIRSEQLIKAEEAASLGADNARAIEALKSGIDAIDLIINRSTVNMERARLTALETTGKELSNFDLQLALFIADPAGLSIDALRSAALQNNPDINMSNLNLEVMSLELTYQEFVNASETFELAKAEIDRVISAYEMGKASRYDLDAALVASIEARIVLYARLAACSKETVKLNALTGNWLATEKGFYNNVFQNAPPEAGLEPGGISEGLITDSGELTEEPNE